MKSTRKYYVIHKKTTGKPPSVGDHVLKDHMTGKDKSSLHLSNQSKKAGGLVFCPLYVDPAIAAARLYAWKSRNKRFDSNYCKLQEELRKKKKKKMEYGDAKAFLDNLEYINKEVGEVPRYRCHPSVREVIDEGIYEQVVCELII